MAVSHTGTGTVCGDGKFSRDVLYYVTKREILTKNKETGYFTEKFTVPLYYWTKLFVTKAQKIKLFII